MIQIFPAEKRYIQRMGWLDVYSVFSCNNYFDPWNTHFANLIAFNEYVMQPGFGFNMHPHEDIEQVFLVTEGQLSHADSLGNEGVLSPGGIQSISAGSGLRPVRLQQGRRSLPLPCGVVHAQRPAHERRATPGPCSPAARTGSPVPLVSGSPELLRAFHEFRPSPSTATPPYIPWRLHASEYPTPSAKGSGG